MVAALDLGSSAERRGGSSPFIRTKKNSVMGSFFYFQLLPLQFVNSGCDFKSHPEYPIIHNWIPPSAFNLPPSILPSSFYLLPSTKACLYPCTSFQCPRVKSGISTGALLFSSEMAVNGPKQHHSAKSYTSISRGKPLRRQ